MNVVDAREFYWAAPPFEEQPLFRAPDDVVAGWVELANLAQAELERFGIPAAVVTDDSPNALGSPAGVQIIVSHKRPYGVILDWEPALAGTIEYKNIVMKQSLTSPLLKYVTKANEVMRQAVLSVLSAAEFGIATEISETEHYYRVLSAPQTPMLER
ncbi:hypothetical protein [Amycolatopsis sp. NPDC051372]|uniref:hypothetical protein n=1 Tax=Amycolatopsis sp. NPDC051372 TaxID=3155669 RepID=UPI00341E4E73